MRFDLPLPPVRSEGGGRVVWTVHHEGVGVKDRPMQESTGEVSPASLAGTPGVGTLGTRPHCPAVPAPLPLVPSDTAADGGDGEPLQLVLSG